MVCLAGSTARRTGMMGPLKMRAVINVEEDNVERQTHAPGDHTGGSGVDVEGNDRLAGGAGEPSLEEDTTGGEAAAAPGEDRESCHEEGEGDGGSMHAPVGEHASGAGSTVTDNAGLAVGADGGGDAELDGLPSTALPSSATEPSTESGRVVRGQTNLAHWLL